MIKMYEKVKSTRKVGKYFGISKATVSKLLKQNGVEVKSIHKSDDDIRKIIDLYKEYGSIKSVHKITHFKNDTIVKYVKEFREEYQKPRVYNHIYSYNETIFDIIDTEEKAYWLGFLYADGCISDYKGYPCSVAIGLQIDDVEHLYKFARFIGGQFKMVKVNVAKSRCDIKVNNKHMAQSLINLGCTPRKSLTLVPPNESQLQSKYKKHFIRGYFDGDGTICKRKRGNYCFGFVGTPEMIMWLSQYFYDNVGCRQIKNYVKTDKTWEWKKEGKDAIECAKYIYQNSTIYLDRKFSIICPFME